MGYRIRKGDADMQQALRRIAGEQIDRALAELDDAALSPAARVHQIRKRCKKLRGLLRLVRPAFSGFGAENATFRDLARPLSGARDADTLIRSYDALLAAQEVDDRRRFAAIRARLTREAGEAHGAPALDDRLEDLRAQMQEARRRARGWSLGHKGFRALAGGAGKSYARAREAMQHAYALREDEALHDWRKYLKAHWYHARLASRICPGMMEPHAEGLDRLCTLLGDHHDLCVLDARLAGAPLDFGPRTDVEGFRALIGARKAVLEEEAFRAGRVLLAERREALVRRWRGYWKLWRAGRMTRERLVVKA
ncbi:CHAD domain-containing protein [Oceanicella sp. SM1341]|uniref:CHAD domain-containing protein n=1 Tax=Oceanicella sp. SM1341 TaxID=1548889 RepID=UPI000E4689D9|nr:CHAD domain-containing protein [Oceanicella sp. SM1341]